MLMDESYVTIDLPLCRKFHPETCLRKLYFCFEFFDQKEYCATFANFLLMEPFQIVGAHGNLARAKFFAKMYFEGQKECYGNDSPHLEEWKDMIENPADYIKNNYSTKWKTPIDGIPALSSCPSYKHLVNWVWERKAAGELE